jgi:hypothetical protein
VAGAAPAVAGALRAAWGAVERVAAGAVGALPLGAAGGVRIEGAAGGVALGGRLLTTGAAVSCAVDTALVAVRVIVLASGPAAASPADATGATVAVATLVAV